MPNKTVAQGQQLLESLFGLGRLAGQGISKGAEIYGDFATKPIQILGELIGKASAIPAQNDLKMSLKGTRTEQAINEGKQPDPMKEIMGKVAEKTLTKQLEANAQEVLQQPDGMNILASFVAQHKALSENNHQQPTNEKELGVSLAGQPEQQVNKNSQEDDSVLDFIKSGKVKIIQGKGLNPGGISTDEDGTIIITQPGKLYSFGISSSGATSGLDLLSKAQELVGGKPLQKGEREKLGLDLMNKEQETEMKRRDEFLKSMTEPMTSESVKSLSQVESSLTGLDNVINLLGIQSDESGNVVIQNKGLLTDMNFLNKNRQELKRSRDVFINKALRRDSGAIVGEKEEKQFQGVFGFDIGMGSFLKNPEVIAKSLLESKDQLSRDRNRIVPNEKLKADFQALRQQGFSVDIIYEAYRKRGVL